MQRVSCREATNSKSLVSSRDNMLDYMGERERGEEKRERGER